MTFPAVSEGRLHACELLQRGPSISRMRCCGPCDDLCMIGSPWLIASPLRSTYPSSVSIPFYRLSKYSCTRLAFKSIAVYQYPIPCLDASRRPLQRVYRPGPRSRARQRRVQHATQAVNTELCRLYGFCSSLQDIPIFEDPADTNTNCNLHNRCLRYYRGGIPRTATTASHALGKCDRRV